ncbi:MAG: cytochrome [Sphingomonas bacterium]|nr:cytochrome [Sphingomonas bacterium]
MNTVEQRAAYSLADPAMQADRYACYAAAHARCPVFRDPQLGFFVINDYSDVREILGNPKDFSSVVDRTRVMQGANAQILRDVLSEGGGWVNAPALQRADPPQHNRSRKVVTRAFAAGQVRSIGPRITALAHELIDRFIDRGECDFINEFALPLPGTIIAELLGLDAAEWPRYKAWADNLFTYLVAVLTPDEMRKAAETELEMQLFLAAAMEDRRVHPRDDLLTALVTTEDGDQPLTMNELQGVMHQLITGGYETVISALCHGMLQLIRFPEAMTELRADRSLMPAFINESLRFESPTQGLYRVATRDVELSGVAIPAGSLLHIRYAAANRDPVQFPDPGQFDLHRSNASSHVAFGAFIHSCVGQQLARSELTVAFNTVFDRLDNIRLARPLPVPEHDYSVNYIPLKELRIAFDRAG